MACNSMRSARALLLLALLTACGQPDDEARLSEYETPPANVPAPAAPAPATAPVNAPTGADVEVNTHLDAAHENFVKKDLAKAGDEVRAAAARLKTAAEAAPAGARKGISDAAQKLEGIEAEVRSGALTSIERLDRHLASANAALARDHYLRAADSWAAKDGRAAGRELMATMDQLEAASKRLGQEVKGEVAELGSEVRDMGRKLSDGAQMAEADVDATLKRLGREIERLGEMARAALQR